MTDDFMSMKFLSAKQVADVLGIHEATVFNWIKRKQLMAYKVGNKYKIAEQDIILFLQSKVA